jgi:PKD repeat protein
MKSANPNAPKSGQNRRYRLASKLLGFLFLLMLGHPLFSGNARAQSCCQTCNGNLVTNGDFSQACQTGYSNTLNYALCYNGSVYLGAKGYSEHNDASAYSSAWEGLDHTPGGGTGFMVIDGPDVSDGPQVAWQQSVSVTGGKNYCFSAWVKNACVVCGPDPTLELRIGGLGGTLIATATPARGTGPNGWTQVCGTYYASSSGTINLTVVISSLSFAGNDALLDDISFGEVCCPLPVATFTYSPKPVICKKPITFTSQGVGTGYQWFVNGTGAGTGSSMIYTFNASGTYIIKHTVTNACGSATIQQAITVTCPPGNCCDVCGDEKVINGDFSQPCGTGYTSQLTAAPCYNTSVPINPVTPVGPGSWAAIGGYSEHNDASAYSSAWEGLDHTPGGGSGFMIIDRPDVGYGPKAAWQQSVTGTVGKTYCFSAWVKNACLVCGPDPTLELHINGVSVAVVTPPRGSGPNGWYVLHSKSHLRVLLCWK